MTRTLPQNARFHTLLSQRGFDKEEKEGLVLACTGGRTASSKEMSASEMKEAIEMLAGEQEASIKRMRAKIINIARDIFELRPKDTWCQVHYDNLNTFLVSKFKQPLHKLEYKQLIKAVTAAEAWRTSVMNNIVKTLLNGV